MIIWQGLGFLALVIPFVAGLIAMLLANAILGQVYVTGHAWPLGVGLILGAASVYLLSVKLNQPGRTLVDPGTGQAVILKRKHTLFWIPMKYYAIVIAAIGTFLLFIRPD